MKNRESTLHPLIELTRVRLFEFVRNPGTLFWVFVFPVLLAVALGIAFRNQPPKVPKMAVTGSLHGAISARLSKEKEIGLVEMDEEEARHALRTGKIDIIVSADEKVGGVPLLEYHFDPTRPESRHARFVADSVLQRAFGRVDSIEAEDREVTEVGGRYIDFLIPGLIGLNIMSSCMWGIGYTVVDSRKRKLLKRFAATPMNRSHFLLSFILSRLIFLVAEVAALILFGFLIFKVTVNGSLIGVTLFSVLGAFAFSGLALLVAARPVNTEVASGWMNFVMLPMWLLSGSFFSYDRFPESMQAFIRLLPLTALNDGLRIVINEGAPFWTAGAEVIVLLGWGILGFVIALYSFRWQ